MVRDKYGRKMSKSLGNVIDPLEVINGCKLEDLLQKIEDGNLPKKEVCSGLFSLYFYELLFYYTDFCSLYPRIISVCLVLYHHCLPC